MLVLIFVLVSSSVTSPRAVGQGVADMVAQAKRTVVLVANVDAKGNLRGFGSGFFVDESGYILTAYHVVSQASIIGVRTSSGQVSEAAVAAADPDADLALLKISGGPYPVLQLAEVSRVRQGDEVVVIGFPAVSRFAAIKELEVSITKGIVSAIRANGLVYQLDAAVNRGNSGGPVLTADGRVIGVAFAKWFEYEGIGFAVSIRAGERLLARLPKRPVSASPEAASALFFPLSIANRWEFEVRSSGRRKRVILEVLSRTKEGSLPAVWLKWSDTGETQKLYVTSSGVYLSVEEVRGQYEDRYNPPRLLLVLPATAGRRWENKWTRTIVGVGKEEHREERTISRTDEPVKTPAGQFQGISVDFVDDSSSPRGTSRVTGSMVFVPGIGIVYLRLVRFGGESREYSLERFKFTALPK